MKQPAPLIFLLLLLASPWAAATPEVADAAPDFTLQGSDGKTYSLKDFQGKQAVVIAWFPMAFTSGCTIECKSLAQNGHLIRAYDVTYFMASVDANEGERGNAAFAAEHQADFPILSDPSRETARAYGVLNERGFANRWTFYIDREGIIRYIDRDVNQRLATSAEFMAQKLGELGTAKRGASAANAAGQASP
jgi:peroxiredoxin Q/BCP